MSEVAQYGIDHRVESRNAVKALIAVLFKRFPTDIQQIENWTDGYFDNLGGMKPEGIKAVYRDVLNSWRWKRPPLPGDFVEARDAHLAAAKARHTSSDSPESPDISQAVKAGGRAWEYEGVPTLGAYWEGQYRDLASLGASRSEIERYVAEDIARMKSHGWVQAKDRKPVQKRVSGFRGTPAIPGINTPAKTPEEFEEAPEE